MRRRLFVEGWRQQRWASQGSLAPMTLRGSARDEDKQPIRRSGGAGIRRISADIRRPRPRSARRPARDPRGIAGRTGNTAPARCPDPRSPRSPFVIAQREMSREVNPVPLRAPQQMDAAIPGQTLIITHAAIGFRQSTRRTHRGVFGLRPPVPHAGDHRDSYGRTDLPRNQATAAGASAFGGNTG